MSAATENDDVTRKRIAAVVFAITLIAVTVIRYRLAPLPLERDEGEYACGGQLALQGVPPFVELYNMKMPGIYWAYAVVMAFFGQSQTGIHLGLLAVNLVTVLSGYRLALRFFDALTAALMASTYAWLSLGAGVLGASTHAEHFVVMFTVLGLLCLPAQRNAIRPGLVFLSGVLLGVAFTMKQHAAPFILFGFLSLVAVLLRSTTFSMAKKCLHAVLFAAGVALPFVVICLVMLKAGAFAKFWFWTVTYARAYVSIVSLRDAGAAFALGSMIAIGAALPIWLLAAVGLVGLRRNKTQAAMVIGLLIAGLIAISPGFYFRTHYYILLLPAIAALAVIGAQEIARLPLLRKKRLVALLIIIGIAWGDTIYVQRRYLFSMVPFLVSRNLFGTQPFPESLEIARYIQENSDPADRVAILGSEPQILFYAQRRSATPFIYMYPLMEPQPYAAEMQRDMIADLERAKPKFIVQVNHPVSWLIQKASARDLVDWYPGYMSNHYRLVGIFDIGPLVSEFYWDEELKDHSHHADYTIDIFARSDSLPGA